jgi:hypothetical protein
LAIRTFLASLAYLASLLALEAVEDFTSRDDSQASGLATWPRGALLSLHQLAMEPDSQDVLAGGVDASVADTGAAEPVPLEVGTVAALAGHEVVAVWHCDGTPYALLPSSVRHLSHWLAPAAISRALIERGSSAEMVMVMAGTRD